MAGSSYTYTGQCNEMDAFGLMYYNARWYDPALGRFIQADTVVAGASTSPSLRAGPLAWDRYAYTLNNPLRYSDPSGHAAVCGVGNECEGKGGGGDDTPDEKPTSQQQPINEEVAETLSTLAFYTDLGAMVLSTGEQWFADGLGLVFTGLGCLSGPAGCVEGLSYSFQADFLIAGANPFAWAEDGLGIVSLGLTVTADFFAGNTRNGYIGRDTIVSARNMLLGLIPESNIDAWISQSQLEYDMNSQGGAIRITNTKELVKQVIWDDTFYQPWTTKWFPDFNGR